MFPFGLLRQRDWKFLFRTIHITLIRQNYALLVDMSTSGYWLPDSSDNGLTDGRGA